MEFERVGVTRFENAAGYSSEILAVQRACLVSETSTCTGLTEPIPYIAEDSDKLLTTLFKNIQRANRPLQIHPSHAP